MYNLSQTALDLDGVIFDYEKTFQKEAVKLNMNIRVKHPEIYSMTDRYEITQEQVSLINLRIDFTNMDIFDEILSLRHHIDDIMCFITASPKEILHLRKKNLSKIFKKNIPVYYAETEKKHDIINDLGIKYFIDDYNATIHYVNINCPDCNAYWLDRGYKDKTLPDSKNKINNLTEFFD
ncbi:hypothetical protein ACMCNP_08280 [Candidatus Acidulodesulfobacterium sp. H_13]|uniref:hypothetical protein n=1 Tax=Candidatus Acidulodesulfobacterium sp. H_13 TaxID=3395470 RepID=UPI003AF9BA4D